MLLNQQVNLKELQQSWGTTELQKQYSILI